LQKILYRFSLFAIPKHGWAARKAIYGEKGGMQGEQYHNLLLRDGFFFLFGLMFGSWFNRVVNYLAANVSAVKLSAGMTAATSSSRDTATLKYEKLDYQQNTPAAIYRVLAGVIF